MFTPDKFTDRYSTIEARIARGYDPPLAYKSVYGFYPRGRDTWLWLSKMTVEVIEADIRAAENERQKAEFWAEMDSAALDARTGEGEPR